MPYRGPWRRCYRPKGIGRNKKATVFGVAPGDSRAETRIQSGYSVGSRSRGEAERRQKGEPRGSLGRRARCL
jgi:hypothetical protein